MVVHFIPSYLIEKKKKLILFCSDDSMLGC